MNQSTKISSIHYRYHKLFSLLSFCCFTAMLCFVVWKWTFHYTYKNYYYSHELQQFVGESVFVKKYPFQQTKVLLDDIVFEYHRGPVDPFLRNPLSGKGKILFAILMEDRVIINLSGNILEHIQDEQEEEKILGSIILTFQSCTFLQKKVKYLSFVFSGDLVRSIQGGINLDHPIVLKTWQPGQISITSTWPIHSK